MAKPFSIQAPEDIAKDYAGNKQMIAQAAQMGVVDPTAAVLAGMFIDRMRSAQVMEAAQQPTVAQQVLGGGGSPMPSPQGLGANPSMPPPPPNMPPMAPPQMAPQAPQGTPPQGMAMGGIASLPVPDAMFDEPMNGGFGDGYAGGGLVAFSGGGGAFSDPAEYGAFIEQTAKGLFPNLAVAGRGRTAARNAQVGGVAGSYHLIDAARDLSVPPGMSKAEFMGQLKSALGPDYDVLPSKGNSVHVEPGPALGQKVRGGTAGKPIPERNISTAEGRSRSTMDEFERLQKMFGRSPEEQEVENMRMARAKEMASDEYYEKQRKGDMWQTLAEIGFNMASSKSPYLLQAIGEAAAASMPGARADKKERKALKDRALDVMGDMNGRKRSENLQLYAIASDAAKTTIEQERYEEQAGLEQEKLDLAREKLRAEIAAANRPGAPSIDQILLGMIASGGASKTVAEEFMGKRYGGGAGSGVEEDIKRRMEGGAGNSPQNPAAKYQ